jgi:hypothetical protein
MERVKKDVRDKLIEEMKRLVDIHTGLTNPDDPMFRFKKSLWYFNKYVLPKRRNLHIGGVNGCYLNIPKKGYKKYQVGRGGIITFSQIPDSDAFKERLSRFIEGVLPLLSEDIKILEEKIAKAVADTVSASAARKAADAEVMSRYA